ncbi:EMYY motif lipoprotein [Macrococcoides caseolyticum]|uniref:EMYY motif lipoprotein n=1 Tax=Macrococcoides caseolyticum TaxID=69966 RepID=UPI001F30897D|nr:EMYY motif lipoprotein [Macrococcus caseolyticus]MCE4955862.1 EMYY motif lipoprotein [Macrococcus caseolyticus]
MKKLCAILFLILISCVIAGCGNKVKSDINDYKGQMEDVQSEEKKLVTEIDKLGLDKADQLFGTEVTEEKKQKLQEIEENIDHKIKPQLKVYEKSAKAVAPETKEVRAVHDLYMRNLIKKKQFISELDQYMKLFNQSISSNEKILEYTKVFERNKELNDLYVHKAEKNPSDTSDFNTLSKLINNNSEVLKKKVSFLTSDATISEKQKYIDRTLIPLLQSNVDKLNQTKLKSNNVIGMRKATIETYYSLIHYYEERKVAMKTENDLQALPIQDILENAKYIKSIDEKYYAALNALEAKQ